MGLALSPAIEARGDLLCPCINVGPLAVVARVPAESFEQQPSPCGPLIKINVGDFVDRANVDVAAMCVHTS